MLMNTEKRPEKRTYRVSTNELYTLKIIQRTNAAYLDFTSSPVDRKTLKDLFQMTRVVVVVAHLH
jgi:hypothetical protein